MITQIIYKTILASIILVLSLVVAMYSTLIERKVAGWFQDRHGPNRAGPWGLLQPLADGIKLFFKEEFMPNTADKFLYILGPSLTMFVALLTSAAIPWGPDLVINGQTYAMQVADINIGILYIFAIVSIGVYGIMIGGWASNNKYASLGGLRASAQMISYELAFGLSLVAVVLMASSASLNDIVKYQQPGNILGWLIFRQPIAAGIFAICAMAELARAPFDLVEAEQELTAGFLTEYGGMKFALFYMSEYVKMIAMSALFATFFLGGWSGPFVNEFPVLSLVYFAVKVLIGLLIIVWVRATLPRFRYDKLMAFGWKALLPLSLANVMLTALLIVLGVY